MQDTTVYSPICFPALAVLIPAPGFRSQDKISRPGAAASRSSRRTRHWKSSFPRTTDRILNLPEQTHRTSGRPTARQTSERAYSAEIPPVLLTDSADTPAEQSGSVRKSPDPDNSGSASPGRRNSGSDTLDFSISAAAARSGKTSQSRDHPKQAFFSVVFPSHIRVGIPPSAAGT